MRVVGLVILAIVVAVIAWAATGINAIPTREEQASAAWAQVLNQYQRRAELIPNLVATVKGAAEFEKSTLEAVVEARAKVGTMQLPADILTNPEAMRAFEANQGALSSALSLFVRSNGQRSPIARTRSVRTTPGHNETAATPRFFSSMAMSFAIRSTPALATPYGTLTAYVPPAKDDTFTMRPRPRGIIARAAKTLAT